jgi:hypothetical protein
MIYLKAGGIYLLAMLVIAAYFLFGTSKTAGAHYWPCFTGNSGGLSVLGGSPRGCISDLQVCPLNPQNLKRKMRMQNVDVRKRPAACQRDCTYRTKVRALRCPAWKCSTTR